MSGLDGHKHTQRSRLETPCSNKNKHKILIFLALALTVFLYACNEITPQEQAQTNEGNVKGNCNAPIPSLSDWCLYNQPSKTAVQGIGFANSEPITTGKAISNAQQLKEIKKDLTGSYYLTSDIDTKEVDISISGEFTGTLEGNGHVIYNIKLTNKPGLFETLKNARVANLALGVVSISGGGNVGALAGTMDGENSIVENVAVAPMVANEAVSHISNADKVGGLIGLSYGGMLTGYNFGVNIKGTTSGGIIGIMGGGDFGFSRLWDKRSSPSTKLIGFSSAKIAGTGVGGLVGVGSTPGLSANPKPDYTPIFNGYDGIVVGIAIGDISSNTIVTGHGEGAGGLVGYNLGAIIIGIATGDVTGNNIGGLVGTIDANTISQRDGVDLYFGSGSRVLNGIATGTLTSNYVKYLTGLTTQGFPGISIFQEAYSTQDTTLSKTRTEKQWKEETGLKSEVILCMVDDYFFESSKTPSIGSQDSQCKEKIGEWTFPTGDWPRISLPKVVTQYWDGVIVKKNGGNIGSVGSN